MKEQAEALMREGRWEDAAAKCREGLMAQPANAMLHAMEGMCYFRLGRFADAEKALGRACLFDTKLSDAAIKQAQCLEKLGRYREAMTIVKEWIPKRPNDIALQAMYDHLKCKEGSEERDQWEDSQRAHTYVLKTVGTESR